MRVNVQSDKKQNEIPAVTLFQLTVSERYPEGPSLFIETHYIMTDTLK